MAYLSTSLLLDEATGPFKAFPPDGALQDLETLAAPAIEAAEWEVDKSWQDTLMGLPEDFQMLECCVHANENECKGDHHLDKVREYYLCIWFHISNICRFLIKNSNFSYILLAPMHTYSETEMIELGLPHGFKCYVPYTEMKAVLAWKL